MKSITNVELFQALNNAPEIIVFDTETSGLNPKVDRIIQVSAIKISTEPTENGFKEIDRLNLYIKPPFQIDDFIVNLTGITNEILSESEDEEKAFPKIFNFFGESPAVAAYNSSFDITYMKALYERNDRVFNPIFNVDVAAEARELIPNSKVPNHKQSTIAEKLGISPEEGNYHNSMADTTVCKKLFDRFYAMYKSGLASEKENVTVYRLYYYENRDWNQRLIYLVTSLGKIYFNAKKYSWGESSDAKGVLKKVDIPKLEKWLFKKYNVNSYTDFVKAVKAETYQKAKKTKISA